MVSSDKSNVEVIDTGDRSNYFNENRWVASVEEEIDDAAVISQIKETMFSTSQSSKPTKPRTKPKASTGNRWKKSWKYTKRK